MQMMFDHVTYTYCLSTLNKFTSCLFEHSVNPDFITQCIHTLSLNVPRLYHSMYPDFITQCTQILSLNVPRLYHLFHTQHNVDLTLRSGTVVKPFLTTVLHATVMMWGISKFTLTEFLTR